MWREGTPTTPRREWPRQRGQQGLCGWSSERRVVQGGVRGGQGWAALSPPGQPGPGHRIRAQVSCRAESWFAASLPLMPSIQGCVYRLKTKEPKNPHPSRGQLAQPTALTALYHQTCLVREGLFNSTSRDGAPETCQALCPVLRLQR